MRVLVTGGTGFVGREVVRQLAAGGHQVCLLTRRPEARPARPAAGGAGLEAVVGDVTDPASLPRALGGCEAVVHLVGIISEVGAQTFERVHVEGTRHVVEAAARAGAVRFIHMSALGARAAAPARYHQTKWAAEEAVRQGGVPWTVLRPSIIYGPGDQFVNLFAKLSRWSPVVPVMGRGEGRLQPISVEAVAGCFVRALETPEAVGQTYDLCGSEVFTFVEVLESILAVTGRRRVRWHVPLGLARLLAAGLAWGCPRLLGRAPPLNRDQLLMLQEDNVGDPTAARRQLSLVTEPFRVGIARYLTPRSR